MTIGAATPATPPAEARSAGAAHRRQPNPHRVPRAGPAGATRCAPSTATASPAGATPVARTWRATNRAQAAPGIAGRSPRPATGGRIAVRLARPESRSASARASSRSLGPRFPARRRQSSRKNSHWTAVARRSNIRRPSRSDNPTCGAANARADNKTGEQASVHGSASRIARRARAERRRRRC